MKLRTIGLWGRGAKPHFVKLWSGRGSEHDFAEAYALPLICSSLFTPHRWICGLTSNVTRFSEHFALYFGNWKVSGVDLVRDANRHFGTKSVPKCRFGPCPGLAR